MNFDLDVRKIGSQSNKINECGNEKQKIHNTIETHIYMVYPVWVTYTREISRSFLLLSNKMKGYNLKHTCCNFLYFLSRSTLS